MTPNGPKVTHLVRMRADLSTGDLARATGNTVRTIRFYEEEGLLKPAAVRGGGHRRYTEGDLERLKLISDLRELGLSLGEIKTVLQLRAGCKTAAEFALRFQDVLIEQIESAQRRLERLKRVKRELTDALATVKERISREMSQRCPCAMAETGEEPRIVKVVTADTECEHNGKPDSELV